MANRRILRDVQALQQAPLTDHGIHYKHDETDMYRGRALLLGPEDTPYYGGLFFFDLEFPADYPYRPPKAVFRTQGARFHPNFYETGKVCLSILNTWEGEQWTSCLTISSVLLALVAIMDARPLLHEPAYTSNHRDFNKYTRYVQYKTLENAVLQDRAESRSAIGQDRAESRSAIGQDRAESRSAIGQSGSMTQLFADEIQAHLAVVLPRLVELMRRLRYAERDEEVEHLTAYGIHSVVYRYKVVYAQLADADRRFHEKADHVCEK